MCKRERTCIVTVARAHTHTHTHILTTSPHTHTHTHTNTQSVFSGKAAPSLRAAYLLCLPALCQTRDLTAALLPQFLPTLQSSVERAAGKSAQAAALEEGLVAVHVLLQLQGTGEGGREGGGEGEGVREKEERECVLFFTYLRGRGWVGVVSGGI